MQFDDKDIEAVAEDRINRAENKVTMYWIVGIVAAIIAGAFVMQTQMQYKVAIGWTLSIAGVAMFFYYMKRLSNKQNKYKAELLDAWYKEQQGQGEKK